METSTWKAVNVSFLTWPEELILLTIRLNDEEEMSLERSKEQKKIVRRDWARGQSLNVFDEDEYQGALLLEVSDFSE